MALCATLYLCRGVVCGEGVCRRCQPRACCCVVGVRGRCYRCRRCFIRRTRVTVPRVVSQTPPTTAAPHCTLPFLYATPSETVPVSLHRPAHPLVSFFVFLASPPAAAAAAATRRAGLCPHGLHRMCFACPPHLPTHRVSLSCLPGLLLVCVLVVALRHLARQPTWPTTRPVTC